MDRNNDDTPVLVGQSGPLNGQRWMVRSKIIVGRDMECDIIIPSRQVSRRHARLTVSNSGATLEDLGSKNGTHLNGAVLSEPEALKDGDVVQIAFAQTDQRSVSHACAQSMQDELMVGQGILTEFNVLDPVVVVTIFRL